MPDLIFLSDSEIYRTVILDAIPQAQRFVWIATADIKDLYIHRNGRMAPFLELLSELVDRGVSLRLLHAQEPGPAFQKDFDRFPNLIEGMERLLCPRVHFKCVIVDSAWVYTGSANLTGAGMGAKSENRRNFENGIVTRDASLIKAVMRQFDTIWMAGYCPSCQRTEFCAEAQGLREEAGLSSANIQRRTKKKPRRGAASMDFGFAGKAYL